MCAEGPTYTRCSVAELLGTSSLEHRSASPFVGNIMLVQKKHIVSGLLIRLYPLLLAQMYIHVGDCFATAWSSQHQDLPALFSRRTSWRKHTFIFQGTLGPKLYGGFHPMVGFPNKPMGFPTTNDHNGVCLGGTIISRKHPNKTQFLSGEKIIMCFFVTSPLRNKPFMIHWETKPVLKGQGPKYTQNLGLLIRSRPSWPNKAEKLGGASWGSPSCCSFAGLCNCHSTMCILVW